MTKRYLGDGVYVAITNGMIELTTEDGGPRATNRIFLEPEVFEALRRWVEQQTKKEEIDAR